MSLDITTSQLSFRARYARRLTREKIYRELIKYNGPRGNLPHTPGQIFEGFVPSGPYNLPHDPKSDYRSEPSPDLGSFKFCIVGAGVAGLFLAMILSRAGIPYDLLEASNRVGGRLYTKEFSKDPHDYYDIGAMRYPDIPLMKK
jgi:NAD(P)-binding Rossmann-like domain